MKEDRRKDNSKKGAKEGIEGREGERSIDGKKGEKAMRKDGNIK